MKQLLIIRHAKSSWELGSMNDFDRPLNDRGHKDASKMAKRVFNKKIRIDAFVSSTANRAFTTAAYFAEMYGLSQNNIIQARSLYHATVPVFYEVVSLFSNTYNTVAVFSHNPGITAFVNELTDTKIDNMPTCSIFALQAETDSWKGFKNAGKQFWFFDYPKQQD